LSFLGNSKPLLLVYRNMRQETLSQTVNIMLPPQFYTFKREPLPVKYAFQAKKVAPSLFEGLLEHTENYDYMVYREDDHWVFIAYNMVEIAHFLKSKGIGPEQVGKVFFAQQALDRFETPVQLGEKDVLFAIDGVVGNVPRAAFREETKIVQIDDSFTPSNGLSLQDSFNSFISQKQSIGLATLFTLFALIFFTEGWRYGSTSQTLKQEIETLLEEYPSLESQYKRQSIAKKYRVIDKNERKKRDIVKTLGSMIFKGVKVESFKMNDKGFTVRFKCDNTKVAKQLRELGKKEGFASIKTLTGNIVTIEEHL